MLSGAAKFIERHQKEVQEGKWDSNRGPYLYIESVGGKPVFLAGQQQDLLQEFRDNTELRNYIAPMTPEQAIANPLSQAQLTEVARVAAERPRSARSARAAREFEPVSLTELSDVTAAVKRNNKGVTCKAPKEKSATTPRRGSKATSPRSARTKKAVTLADKFAEARKDKKILDVSKLDNLQNRDPGKLSGPAMGNFEYVRGVASDGQQYMIGARVGSDANVQQVERELNLPGLYSAWSRTAKVMAAAQEKQQQPGATVAPTVMVPVPATAVPTVTGVGATIPGQSVFLPRP